jgi:transcriptional regulator with XRE-family HTH domain
VSPRSANLAEYLRARRAQLKPEDVGFPADVNRRVRGLKRAELAELAGISLEYYTRLEQGRTYRLSEQVLTSLTQALKLAGDEAAYFYRLALPEPPVSGSRPAPEVSDAVRRLAAEWSDFPLYVFDRNQDILLANDIATALFPLVVAGNNAVESSFLVPASTREFHLWKTLARDIVAAFRFHGDADDPRFREIVAGLSLRDADFRSMWADYEARPFTSGIAPVFIEGYGSGDFPWQVLALPDGLFMVVWVAPAGSFAAEGIGWLRNKIRGTPA